MSTHTSTHRTGLDFERFFSSLAGEFTEHIDASIPNYAANRAASAAALVRILKPGAEVIDVGGSEGTFGNLVSRLSDGQIHTTTVDPNPHMEAAWLDAGPERGTEYEVAAWGDGFYDAENGIQIDAYEPLRSPSVIHMSMVRQFVTDDVDAWYGHAADMLPDDGLFIVNTKVIDGPDWDEREAWKDDYKRRTFTEDQITRKAEETLVGMHQLMVSLREEYQALAKHFRFVRVYWRSGNFYGFVAGQTRWTVSDFVNAHAEVYAPTYTEEVAA